MGSPEMRSFFQKIICCNYFSGLNSNIIDDGKYVKYPVRIGKFPSGVENQNTEGSILLCGKRQSYFPFQCFVGPDWPMLILVYTLILVANISVLPKVYILGWPILLIGVTGFTLLLYFYTAVACSNPGIIFDEHFNDEENGNMDTKQLIPLSQIQLTKDIFHATVENPILESSSSPSNNSGQNYFSRSKLSASNNSNNDIELELVNSNNGLKYENNHNMLSLFPGLPTYYSPHEMQRIPSHDIDIDRDNDLEAETKDDMDIIISDLQVQENVKTDSEGNGHDDNNNMELNLLSHSIKSNINLSRPRPRPDVHPTAKTKPIDKCEQHRVTDCTECGICELKRPHSAHHCHDCGVCVDELDHHCPCKYCFILLNTQCYMQLSLYRL